mmetsp:Transcript_5883/g.5119  ORF Transcript_5883/g.5119 Transcript_5883/m.5119 type:complete len:128 (-) Transcript_5883:1737-2120(-)
MKSGSPPSQQNSILNNSTASTAVSMEETASKGSDKFSNCSSDKEISCNNGFESIIFFEPIKEIREDSKKLSQNFSNKSEPFSKNAYGSLLEDLEVELNDAWNALFPITQSKLVTEIKERESKIRQSI